MASNEGECDVFDLLENTLEQLQTGWDTIGFTREERKKNIDSFCAGIAEFCRQFLASQNLEEENLKTALSEGIEEIRKLAAQLGDGEVKMVRCSNSILCVPTNELTHQ